jgi:hypothetical protein
MNLHISPSKIENFRLFITEAYHGAITKDKVTESIKGETPWLPRMEFGGAFHAVVEHGGDRFFHPASGLYHVNVEGLDDPYILHPEEVAVAEAYRTRYIGMTNEIKAYYKLKIGDYHITISMRIDGLYGTDVHERKTTDKPPKYDNYVDSLQWRCYALATQCDMVYYDVFKYNNPKVGPKEIIFEQFSFQPYPAIETEVKNYTDQLIRFCEREGLLNYIQSKY